MCAFPGPPGLFIATPAQEPEAWILVVFLVGCIVFAGVKAVRSPVRSGERRLWAGGCLFFIGALAGGFLDLVAVLPWQGAVRAWYARQFGYLLAHNCSTAALTAVYGQVIAQGDRLFVAGKFIQLCSGVFALLWVGMLFWGLGYYHQWRARRSS